MLCSGAILPEVRDSLQQTAWINLFAPPITAGDALRSKLARFRLTLSNANRGMRNLHCGRRVRTVAVPLWVKKIGIKNFVAHDLRRTCAKLCRKSGGDLEQLKFLLGHSSIQTTERYLGSEQEIAVAVNDSWSL